MGVVPPPVNDDRDGPVGTDARFHNIGRLFVGLMCGINPGLSGGQAQAFVPLFFNGTAEGGRFGGTFVGCAGIAHGQLVVAGWLLGWLRPLLPKAGNGVPK